MLWQVTARRVAQRWGLEPRYLRRLRWLSKARAVRNVGTTVRGNLAFVLIDPEPANFTYPLANEPELVTWVAAVLGCERARVDRLFEEARTDTTLSQRLRRATAGRSWWTKRCPPFGKRLAWYALARIVRPQLIIETGVHDGLGSLILLRALERNQEEDSPGRLVSFDINPASGWIVGAHPLWELRVESTRVGLPSVLPASAPVGLFIHDSFPSYEQQRYELQIAAAHLSPDGVLISDDTQVTHALSDICRELGLEYHEFCDRPLRHHYPGGAMGAGRRSLGPPVGSEPG